MNKTDNPVHTHFIHRIIIYSSRYGSRIGINISISLCPKIFITAHDFMQLLDLITLYTGFVYTT